MVILCIIIGDVNQLISHYHIPLEPCIALFLKEIKNLKICIPLGAKAQFMEETEKLEHSYSLAIFLAITLPHCLGESKKPEHLYFSAFFPGAITLSLSESKKPELVYLLEYLAKYSSGAIALLLEVS